MRIIIFLFLFLLSTITPVNAKMTGEEWMKLCESPESIDNLGCMMYLGGTRDMYTMMNDPNFESYVYVNGEKHLIKKTCFPNGVTIGQQKKIMMKYLNNNPKELHERFEYIYSIVIRDTFPCKD
jgi:hypothetical protein